MKNIKKLLILSLMLIFALPFTARCDGITVTLDGNTLSFDVPPQIIDGRTLVPMRAIFEAIGTSVEWDGDTQTVTAYNSDQSIIELKIGSYNIKKTVKYTETENITLDVPPQIIDGRTLVPVRAVAESLDAKVEWDGNTQTVIIESAKKSAAEPVQTTKPSPSPAPVSEQDTDLIEYDASLEPTVGYMKNFRILSAKLNSDGNFDIVYTLQTYLEGRGDVAVGFNCFDSEGNLVDSWVKLHHGTDYTWSDHTAAVTISGKTTKIQLAP